MGFVFFIVLKIVLMWGIRKERGIVILFNLWYLIVNFYFFECFFVIIIGEC